MVTVSALPPQLLGTLQKAQCDEEKFSFVGFRIEFFFKVNGKLSPVKRFSIAFQVGDIAIASPL